MEPVAWPIIMRLQKEIIATIHNNYCVCSQVCKLLHDIQVMLAMFYMLFSMSFGQTIKKSIVFCIVFSD